ncbi:hypothetical protein F5Y19DRAFT_441068 [Xylariaceae sp. FL1651]|nr:hypothetical protein F5Y19DRAFT_441068 [Xylariaceae sp. FL1651]
MLSASQSVSLIRVMLRIVAAISARSFIIFWRWLEASNQVTIVNPIARHLFIANVGLSTFVPVPRSIAR